MTIETERNKVLFQIAHVLRTRCRGYLKIRERVDDPIPNIIARDILEQWGLSDSAGGKVMPHRPRHRHRLCRQREWFCPEPR
jgi:hypothetical protein